MIADDKETLNGPETSLRNRNHIHTDKITTVVTEVLNSSKHLGKSRLTFDLIFLRFFLFC